MSKARSDRSAAGNFDRDALVAIFDQYSTVLYRYSLRLCADPIVADQIVGDVFSRFLDQVAIGKGPKKNPRAYLFQSAYNAIVDRAREEQRTAPLDIADSFLETEKSLSTQVEENMLLEELQVAINNNLTEEQQHIIILRFQEEFSLQETAEIVGKTVNAVKALQNRAVQKLRHIMNETARDE